MDEGKAENRPRVTDPSLGGEVPLAIVDGDAIYRAGLKRRLCQHLVSTSYSVDVHDESVLAMPGEDIY